MILPTRSANLLRVRRNDFLMPGGLRQAFGILSYLRMSCRFVVNRLVFWDCHIDCLALVRLIGKGSTGSFAKGWPRLVTLLFAAPNQQMARSSRRPLPQPDRSYAGKHDSRFVPIKRPDGFVPQGTTRSEHPKRGRACNSLPAFHAEWAAKRIGGGVSVFGCPYSARQAAEWLLCSGPRKAAGEERLRTG